MSATARALAAAGATRLDVLLTLVDRDDSYSDSRVPADAVEGAAHVARAWFVASESVSPSPNPRASAPLAGVEPTLASLAPLVHALFRSPHGDPPARVRTLTSALDLAALGFRRAARGAESTASIDAAPAARRVVEALARVVAASPDPSAREKARLALSRAFACADASARFRLVSELLADAPSPAVAAMVLTRATRDAAAEWDVEPDFQVEFAREEESREEIATRDPTPSFAFATPEALALVEGQIRRAIGTHASDATWPPAHDPAGAADVLGAALNYVRFATMRGSRADRAGAWKRRREVMAASVVPARAWAARRLDAIVAEEARERGVEEGGESSRERAAWEAQMGLHHVVEVCDRVVEFVREEESREGIARSTGKGEAEGKAEGKAEGEAEGEASARE